LIIGSVKAEVSEWEGWIAEYASLRILSVYRHFMVEELEPLRNGNLRFFLDFGRPIE
jgi:hypothetical protein